MKTANRKKTGSRRQMSESFVTAAFLSVSGGLQDAYTYFCRGKVFANAQTGNIVLLNDYLFHGNFPEAVHYLVPLISFMCGVAAAEVLRIRFQSARRLHWRQMILLIEIGLLLFVGFLPGSFRLSANALVSFACAMQVQAFRKVSSYAFASTMCIGNMRRCLLPYKKPDGPLQGPSLLRHHSPLRSRRRPGQPVDFHTESAYNLDIGCLALCQLCSHVHQSRGRGASGDTGRRRRHPG